MEFQEFDPLKRHLHSIPYLVIFLDILVGFDNILHGVSSENSNPARFPKPDASWFKSIPPRH